jgi:protein-tyrosine phosphatase
MDSAPIGTAPARHITFETVFNFRDLGGYETVDGRSIRWRRLFRADGLHRLTEEDSEQFRELGIATVIDLRAPEELDNAGHFTAVPADYHHLPIFDVYPDWSVADPEAAGYLADRYMEMLETGRSAIARALGLLASPSAYPLVFHCAAGKDRTGILASLVLALLRVPDDVIAADYALSQDAMQRLIEWAREHRGTFPKPSTEVPASVIEARPETMTRFLELVRQRFGSVEGLVRDLGLGDDVPGRIQAALLD